MNSRSVEMSAIEADDDNLYEGWETEQQAQNNEADAVRYWKKQLNKIARLEKSMRAMKVSIPILSVVLLALLATTVTMVLFPQHLSVAWPNAENKGEQTANISKINWDITALQNAISSIEAKSFPRTCSQAADLSGSYYIWPMGKEGKSVLVSCKAALQNGTNVVKTLIGHDTEHEIYVGNCAPAYCYKRNVTYDVTMRQIIGLIGASRQCRQYIKYRCRGSTLDTVAAWVSRNGSLEKYWAGDKRDHTCACGETASCINNAYKCNCDQNSQSTWTSDEGYLTNKDDLPVMAMYFGDSGGYSEYGYHTLGQLECWG